MMKKLISGRAELAALMVFVFISCGPEKSGRAMTSQNGKNAPAAEPEKALPAAALFPLNAQGKPATGQGGIFLVAVSAGTIPLASVRATFGEQVIPCLPSDDRSRWIGLGGVSRTETPGPHTISVRMETTAGQTFKAEKTLLVEKTHFPVTSLTVAPEMAKPPPEKLKWMEEDRKAFAQVFSRPSYARLWEGPFLRPVPGPKTAAFGQLRTFNGEVKSVHGGVDLAAGVGEPVRAAARGEVVLLRNCYLAGNTIVLDHGGGLFTYYCHLSRFAVKEGEMVEKGQVVGYAGSTGRVTGPHLHWGARVQGVRVDPYTLLELSKWLQ